MEDLSPEQIVGIADGYCRLARSLNEFQVSRWPELSVEQHLDLNAYQNSLLNRAQDLQTQAVRPAFRNAQEMVNTIQKATEDARTSLKRIKNITVALNVGAISVALASYVARANLRGIQTALSELGDLLTMNED